MTRVCRFCWTWIEQPARGRSRLCCEPCAEKFGRSCDRRVMPSRSNAWYLANRQNNPQWREENKRRTKAWRAKRREKSEAHA